MAARGSIALGTSRLLVRSSRVTCAALANTLSTADCDLDGEVANYLKKLAEVSLQLTRLLDLINSPERELSAAEVEELSETVAALTDAEMDIIDKIESV